MSTSTRPAPHIIIVGAGFAGLSAYNVLSKTLKKFRYQPRITLIDENDHFEYTPALHLGLSSSSQLASAQFSLIDTYKSNFVVDTITHYHAGHITGLSGIEYPYDYLIVATGSRQNYFHNKSFKQHAFPVKTVADVVRLQTPLKNARSIVVIGGGYTGIEIASVLVSETDKQVYLVHAHDRLMKSMKPNVGQAAHNWLTEHGVDVVLNQRVSVCGQRCVELGSGSSIDTDLIILSSGVLPNSDQVTPNPSINAYHQLVSQPNVYICGDAAPNDNLATAHNAMVEGREVAQNVLARIDESMSERQVAITATQDLSAIALGPRDGIVTYGTRGRFVPQIVGLLKKIIQQRVLLEFKHQVLLPL